ncbi:hypothetical protein ACODNH_00625 (plasmid) [Haloarcula sp. NS06]|uniref:hypothetical protein n=1 Tax=Haloarcula sp. NS06 TaxID=3409688 RepID=UPI003DA74CEE
MKEGIESQYDDPDNYRGDYPPDWAYRIVFRRQLDNNTCTNCGTRYPAEDLEVVRRVPAENGVNKQDHEPPDSVFYLRRTTSSKRDA